MSENNQNIEEKISQFMPLIKLALALIVLVGLVFAFVNYRKSSSVESNKEAFGALFEAEKIEQELVGAETDLFTVDVWKKLSSMSSEQKQKYIQILESVAKEHSDSVASTLSLLRLGHLHRYDGKLEESKAYYKQASEVDSKLDKNGLYKVLSLESLYRPFLSNLESTSDACL